MTSYLHYFEKIAFILVFPFWKLPKFKQQWNSSSENALKICFTANNEKCYKLNVCSWYHTISYKFTSNDRKWRTDITLSFGSQGRALMEKKIWFSKNKIFINKKLGESILLIIPHALHENCNICRWHCRLFYLRWDNFFMA